MLRISVITAAPKTVQRTIKETQIVLQRRLRLCRGRGHPQRARSEPGAENRATKRYPRSFHEVWEMESEHRPTKTDAERRLTVI